VFISRTIWNGQRTWVEAEGDLSGSGLGSFLQVAEAGCRSGFGFGREKAGGGDPGVRTQTIREDV
jgi:hypothetical protein